MTVRLTARRLRCGGPSALTGIPRLSVTIVAVFTMVVLAQAANASESMPLLLAIDALDKAHRRRSIARINRSGARRRPAARQ